MRLHYWILFRIPKTIPEHDKHTGSSVSVVKVEGEKLSKHPGPSRRRYGPRAARLPRATGLEVITNYDHVHTFCFQTLMFAALSYWVTTFSLVFGGCCANALTLEQLTLSYPRFGSLITFLQFLLIALHGLPGHLRWTWLGPRLKPRRISIVPYFGQVVLFYGISMLNNWAFAYNIPMPVHIIFRSGGLVVSMLFGWLISRKRYVNIPFTVFGSR